ncbi:hypothetical protein ANN_22352 [Periplaneta americana]|uniref:DUF4817 domain-containing protein n=1 Tax=Periplaneta americana TaxID=6978 RepID=A0ABQ8S881_PERAM|nr:hypothetical protein ANN_22352 [Periplaneta americana]
MPYKFTTEEYADLVFIYGVCEGNATAAAAEYHRHYPNRWILNLKTTSGTFNTIRQTGSLPSIRIHYERRQQNHVAEEENILNAVQRSPRTSTKRVAQRLGVLSQRYGGHSIGSHTWSARSPDFTSLHYCLWGWMKDYVYQINVRTLEELIVCIIDAATIIMTSPEKPQQHHFR